MLSLYNVSRFIGKRLVRYAPFNIFTLLFAIYIVPYQGLGPLWINYVNYIKPCNTLWWTNLIYINNFYPANYDEKCMPWSWFLPTYVQVSLTLPLIIFLYKKSSQTTFLIVV